ncbi:hypothetical protein [Paraburkholderia sp.]|uniref:hypothetical protein n=1 Tax=Paraburkholderia sp. TaxID=1926495 RepID=UPI0025FBA6E6|nr:hypothetical protein [Paraburkholderia sp.]
MKPIFKETASARVGFNLLPWRRREIQRLRRRRLIEWGAALMLGCALSAPLMGWQMWQRSRVEAHRLVVEQSMAPLLAPYAEAQHLASEAAARQITERLTEQRGKPLTRMVALLDALGSAGTAGVVLHQIEHRGDETHLHAALASENVIADWLKRLRQVPDVESVNVREFKRTQQAGNAKQRTSIDDDPIRVITRLAWYGTAAPAQSTESTSQTKVRNPE